MPKRPAHRPRTKRNNRFARWVDGCSMSIELIADKLGLSMTYVYNLRSGRYKASRDVAVAIERLSEGRVTVESWSRKQPKSV